MEGLLEMARKELSSNKTVICNTDVQTKPLEYEECQCESQQNQDAYQKCWIPK